MTPKKNIIIIGDYRDRIGYMAFLKNSDYFQIVLAVVYNEHDKKNLLSLGVRNVKTLEDIRTLDFLDNFSFDVIQKYRAIQRNIEFGMARCSSSNMLIANKYYNALFYFLYFFDNNHIDCVFSTKMPHGFLEETIPLEIAKLRQIPAYFIHCITISYSALTRYDSKETIKIPNQSVSNIILKHVFDIKKLSEYNPKFNFKEKLIKFFGLFIFRIVCAVLKGKKQLDVGFFFKHDLIEECYSFYKFRKMRCHYTKLAETPNYNEKYVFYALHFEPEAVTSIICDLQNQLTVIQLLSKSLPKGWSLYVKEHPHQFELNNSSAYYFIPHLEFFKNANFYDECIKLHNVKLIKHNISSKDLIKKAMAVSTINGSIILESIYLDTPCVTFDNYIDPITKSGLFPNIKVFKNVQDLKDFFTTLAHIEILDEKEKTKRLELLSQYYFDHFDQNISENIVQAIYKDLNKEKNKE